MVAFNFTEVYDTDSRVGKYQWGIGSAPGLADIVPLRDYGGEFKPRDIKVPSGGSVPIRVPQVVSWQSSPCRHMAAVSFNVEAAFIMLCSGDPLSTLNMTTCSVIIVEFSSN